MPVTFGYKQATTAPPSDLMTILRQAEKQVLTPLPTSEVKSTTPVTATNPVTKTQQAGKPQKLTLGKMIGTAIRAFVSYPFAKMAASAFRGVSGVKHIQLGSNKIPLNFNFKQYLAALLALKTINTVSHNASLNVQA